MPILKIQCGVAHACNLLVILICRTLHAWFVYVERTVAINPGLLNCTVECYNPSPGGLDAVYLLLDHPAIVSIIRTVEVSNTFHDAHLNRLHRTELSSVPHLAAQLNCTRHAPIFSTYSDQRSVHIDFCNIPELHGQNLNNAADASPLKIQQQIDLQHPAPKIQQQRDLQHPAPKIQQQEEWRGCCLADNKCVASIRGPSPLQMHSRWLPSSAAETITPLDDDCGDDWFAK